MLKKAENKFKNKAVRWIKMKLKRDEKIKNRIEKEMWIQNQQSKNKLFHAYLDKHRTSKLIVA